MKELVNWREKEFDYTPKGIFSTLDEERAEAELECLLWWSSRGVGPESSQLLSRPVAQTQAHSEHRPQDIFL